MELLKLVDYANDQIGNRKLRSLYARDFDAWLADTLDERMWGKQREVAESVINNTYTAVKSANGTGKSHVASRLVAHFVATHEPRLTNILLTAPVRNQIDSIMFKLIRDLHQKSHEIGRNPLPGRIAMKPAWVIDEIGHEIVQPRRPADQNLISSFQGTHNEFMLIIMDEAGGLPAEMYDAAAAVMTNADAHLLAIGNPNKRNTKFHDIYRQPETYSHWNRYTISAYDLPTFTGEKVYEDEEKERQFRSMLTQPEWVEMRKREAHPAVFAAQVLGEFPDEGDDTFFLQDYIDTAHNTVIEPDDAAYKIMGVDIAVMGEDSSTAYLNSGGHVRLLKEWNKSDHVASARIIHELATGNNVDEVRIDAAGTGAGVYSILDNSMDDWGATYAIRAINGANKSPDNQRWLNARAHHYESFREQLRDGKIDLDFEDTKLTKEMVDQTFEFTDRGQLKITSKDKMRSAGIKSPDHLDAAIYSAIDVSVYEALDRKGGTIYTDHSNFTDEPLFGLPTYLEIMRYG